jgi:hypothetical protein
MASDEPQLIETGRGFTIKYGERYLYSSVDPRAAACRRAARVEKKDASLYFLPSVGMGYGILELLSRLPSGSHVLCVEADRRLMELAERAASLPKSQHLTIVQAHEPVEVVRILQKLGTWRFRRLVTVYLCGGYHLYRSRYDEMTRLLDDEIQNYWKNRLILIHLGRLWIKNLLLNLPLWVVSPDLRGLTATGPIVVTGAGPSLQTSLPLIKKVRRNVILLATDTSLGVLVEAGIRPDLIFALEAQTANLQDFIGMPYAGIPLICDITSTPSVVRLFDGRCFFVSSHFYPLTLFDRFSGAGLLPARIPALGSVGVAALHTALRLTRGAVVLAGLDFGYTGQKPHSSGTPFHKLALRSAQRLWPVGQEAYESIRSRPLLKLADKSGEPIMSDLVLHSYASQTRMIVEGNKRVFDMSIGGLDLGAPPVRTEDDLSGLLPSSTSESKLMCRSIGAEELAHRIGEANELIRRETDLLTEGVARIEQKLKAGERRANGDAGPFPPWDGIFKELSYLYFYFPDNPPLPKSNSSFLLRVCQEARWAMALWKRSKHLLMGR